MTLIQPFREPATFAPERFTELTADVLRQVSVVIPAYNEAGSIADVLRRIPSAVEEILVVDGVSTDDTARVARQTDSRVSVIERTRTGKGNALACGFAAVTKEFVVAFDADGSADPGDIIRMVEPLTRGKDFVKGFRVRDSYRGSVVRNAGASVLSRYFNGRLNSNIADVCCGFIAFKSACLSEFGLNTKSIDVREGPPQLLDGFEIDAVLAVRAITRGLSTSQQPVTFSGRTAGESKTRPARDALRILRAIEEERAR